MTTNSKKTKEPDVDFGFFARIPRILRTGYTNLTPMQKWLYVCLKDLCGDKGTCYRSIRALTEETGISTGMISESIRELQGCELIHAEKKKRATGGKEVWHITIADIWQENGKAHPSKRSHSEQTQEKQNVHSVNVHTVNKNLQECSPAEQECSLCETEVITDKQEHIEGRTGVTESASSVGKLSANASDSNTLALKKLLEEERAKNALLQQQLAAKNKQPTTPEDILHMTLDNQPKRTKQPELSTPAPVPVEKPGKQASGVSHSQESKQPFQKQPNIGELLQLTDAGRQILAWRAEFRGHQVSANPKNIRAANGLGEIAESKEEFQKVQQAILDDTFLKEKGVRTSLTYIYEHYDEFVDVVDRQSKQAEEKKKQEEEAKKPPAEHKIDPAVARNRALKERYAQSTTA